jgi:hypothetical protein
VVFPAAAAGAGLENPAASATSAAASVRARLRWIDTERIIWHLL